MAKSADNRMIVGLDVGTSKVVAVVGGKIEGCFAIDIAASKGICCVNAMGNHGPLPTSLWTPADADSVVVVGDPRYANRSSNCKPAPGAYRRRTKDSTNSGSGWPGCRVTWPR